MCVKPRALVRDMPQAITHKVIAHNVRMCVLILHLDNHQLTCLTVPTQGEDTTVEEAVKDTNDGNDREHIGHSEGPVGVEAAMLRPLVLQGDGGLRHVGEPSKDPQGGDLVQRSIGITAGLVSKVEDDTCKVTLGREDLLVAAGGAGDHLGDGSLH